MDTALAPEAAATTPSTEPAVEAPEPKPLELEEFVHKQIEQLAAPESETDVEPKVAEAAAPAADAKADTPQPPAKTDDVPFSTEQLADPKHWDRLDKAGWERAAKLHPVETARVKAGYAAASRITEQARAAQPRPEPEKPAEPERDQRAEALAKTDSLDPAERAEGFQTLARLEAEKLFKPYEQTLQRSALQTKAVEVERAAYKAAVDSMPEDVRAEFMALDSKELDAAVEGDTELLDDVEIAVGLEPEARVRLLAKVMRRAGRIVMDGKRSAKVATDSEAKRVAEEAKKVASQQRLRSNQSNPSATVAESPGGKSPSGEKSIEETIHMKIAALPK